MEGLALKVPTILVPNPSLADNHQVELAKEFEKAGYCVHGELKFVNNWSLTLSDVYSSLTLALKRAEELRNTKETNMTTVHSTIWTVLDQEMGFTDQFLD
jgi:UDP-N-acetylglucosamine:LPS N-acetylglucosamine transferase